MNNLKKQDFFKLHFRMSSHKTYFLILLCVEILCLSVLLFNGITSPKSELNYSLTNFNHNNVSNVNLKKSNLIFSKAYGGSNNQQKTISSSSFSISSINGKVLILFLVLHLSFA